MSSISSKLQVTESKRREALTEQLQFLGQMSSTETALFHHTIAVKQGLSITDMKTISTLMQEGSMPAGQLAKRLSLTTGAVTSVIDRLEYAGLASRVADPADRRKVIVTVDHKKLKKMGKIYDSVGNAFQQLLENYSNEELQFLVDYYKASIEVTKLEIAKVSGIS